MLNTPFGSTHILWSCPKVIVTNCLINGEESFLCIILRKPYFHPPFLSIFLHSTLGQGKEKESILYSDRQSIQIPIENTSAWQSLDYLTLISLPPSIHSNHWLHFSIYFTINASGPTEQSSDESMAQSISPTPQVVVKVCVPVCKHVSVCACAAKCAL